MESKSSKSFTTPKFRPDPSSSTKKKIYKGGAGMIVLGEDAILMKIAETNNPIMKAKWEKARTNRQEDLKILLKQKTLSI
jgi:hypothetical protein